MVLISYAFINICLIGPDSNKPASFQMSLPLDTWLRGNAKYNVWLFQEPGGK